MTRLIPRLSAAERTAFIAAARSLVDTPFRHRGRTERGIDCLGVVAYALRAVGRVPADERIYNREPEAEGLRLRETLVSHFSNPVGRLVPGCVVLMRWHERPNHVAVLGEYPHGGLSVIHADAASRRVVEHALDGHWPRRVVEGWLP
jgi:cell wall-associated NlpC family hydrolase